MMDPSARRRTAAATLATVTAGALLLPATSGVAATTSPWKATLPSLLTDSRLTDVVATGPDNAWSVGYQASTYTGYSIDEPYALLQWNGQGWTERRLPHKAVNLTKVAAANAGDVWTVGAKEFGQPYAGHFDGRIWTAHAPLGGSPGYADLLDVAATGGGRAVLVGHDGGRPLVVSGDTRGFDRVAVPGTEQENGVLRGVWSTPDGSIFAAGERYVPDAPYPEPMIVQRVGGAWRVAAVPSISSARLTGVWARSSTDAWAVGTQDFDTTPKPVVLHWDGTSWKRVAGPASTGWTYAVAGDANGNVWISGTNPYPPYIEYPGTLLLRYTGGRWSVAYGPKVEGNDPALDALANIPGTSSFWGSGTVTTGGVNLTGVIERTR
ncbi:hypothetical protein [Micromonospora sp. WMMD998]|uniref:hypothetical protein n=1 Tax=Micromonospora sp. WMMD998 TaxID=3016092 RepID=UPI00249A99C9|nr:hypothetical protein [Micromonospora sp. WMMD998]WFE39931.1 hypothetical protein O7619_16430 [Micromonospora sp. WMMD998]